MNVCNSVIAIFIKITSILAILSSSQFEVNSSINNSFSLSRTIVFLNNSRTKVVSSSLSLYKSRIAGSCPSSNDLIVFITIEQAKSISSIQWIFRSSKQSYKTSEFAISALNKAMANALSSSKPLTSLFMYESYTSPSLSWLYILRNICWFSSPTQFTFLCSESTRRVGCFSRISIIALSTNFRFGLASSSVGNIFFLFSSIRYSPNVFNSEKVSKKYMYKS